MTKNILVATDLTARGDRPFQRAAMLKNELKAAAAMIFVSSDKAGIAELDEAVVLKQLRRNYGSETENFSVVIAEGDVPKAIARAAEELDCDLIIVGAARHNNISDFFLGTAVDYLVRNAAIPVLVVKERPIAHYQNILVATDFSDFASYALRTAMNFLPQAKVKLVHAYHVAYEAWLKSDGVTDEMRREAEQEMAGFLEKMNFSEEDKSRISSEIVEGNLHQSIHNTLDEGEVDLLVLGTHGRSGFAQAVIGSRASEMLNWSPVDVLMIRKPH
ncbi:hypothetical protein MNBD_ALPHA04-1952 [hydrothermal vent metagenome]|uniref:UspA domain-containing protein n=1 Tax=hydrothermal vent metagenome TaxID=652676 RepID=A0A3B0RGY0_9ZZZZ